MNCHVLTTFRRADKGRGKNMRVQTSEGEGSDFAEFLLSVGDGSYGGGDMIKIPDDMPMKDSTLTNLVEFVFPDLLDISGNKGWLSERRGLSYAQQMSKQKKSTISSLTDFREM